MHLIFQKPGTFKLNCFRSKLPRRLKIFPFLRAKTPFCGRLIVSRTFTHLRAYNHISTLTLFMDYQWQLCPTRYLMKKRGELVLWTPPRIIHIHCGKVEEDLKSPYLHFFVSIAGSSVAKGVTFRTNRLLFL